MKSWLSVWFIVLVLTKWGLSREMFAIALYTSCLCEEFSTCTSAEVVALLFSLSASLTISSFWRYGVLTAAYHPVLSVQKLYCVSFGRRRQDLGCVEPWYLWMRRYLLFSSIVMYSVRQHDLVPSRICADSLRGRTTWILMWSLLWRQFSIILSNVEAVET